MQGLTCASAQAADSSMPSGNIATNYLQSDLIHPDRLSSLLGETRQRFSLIALAECTSTSTLLLQQAREGAPSGTVIVADRQTAGRGSRGRAWSATPESGLMFSVLWGFPGGLECLSGLSLATGVGVVEALEGSGIAPITLKWPNDILYENGKLGGILIELHADEKQAMAVVGIGLNLRLPKHVSGNHAAALPPAALEQIVPVLPDRHVLLARLLVSLANTFDRFAAGGFAALHDQWHAYHAWQNKKVRLLREGQPEQEGLCVGADMDGALLVKTSNGIERCLSGEVSLRL